MNVYLYPCYNGKSVVIKKVLANNYNSCIEKIMNLYIDSYDDLDDFTEFDEFCEELCDKHGIIIGEVQEVDEFM